MISRHILRALGNEIPPYARAVMEALRFPSRSDARINVENEDWKKVMAFCDRTQLTLPVGLRCKEHLPEPARSRVDHSLARNAARWEQIKISYREAAGALESAGIQFAVLKGFSHCPQFTADPRHRAQYDLDFLVTKTQILTAHEALSRLGYESINGFENSPIDHLPAMIRKTGWTWRGDYFDPGMPLSIELHYRLWDRDFEAFEPQGIAELSERLQRRRLEELNFTAFHPADELGYAALHLVRHLLRGDLRPSHIYELAWFLESHTNDGPFWETWSDLHHESLRRVEALCFALAKAWFDCTLPEAAREEIGGLPDELSRWIEWHALSPLAGVFHPNKDEIWLHWNLVDSPRARLLVLRRRLLPGHVPKFQAAPHLAKNQLTWRIRLRNRWHEAGFLWGRLAHHLRALSSAGWSAIHWFLADAGRRRQDQPGH